MTVQEVAYEILQNVVVRYGVRTGSVQKLARALQDDGRLIVLTDEIKGALALAAVHGCGVASLPPAPPATVTYLEPPESSP